MNEHCSRRGVQCAVHLQSSCTRDDLNQLLGDDSLAGAVERQSQLVNHLRWKITK